MVLNGDSSMWWEVCSGGNNIDGETVSVTVAVAVEEATAVVVNSVPVAVDPLLGVETRP